MFRVRLKYYSVFTYYSLWTNVGRPSLSVALFFLSVPSSPVPGEQRHRVDPAMAVEEARSGPSGLGFRSRPTQVTSSVVFNIKLHPKLQVSQLNFVSNSIGFFDCVRFRSTELARDRPWHRHRLSQVSSLA